MNIASNLEVISPLPILSKTLTPLSEVTLNSGVRAMVLTRFNRVVLGVEIYSNISTRLFLTG